ncbi:MAG: hypothetical protein ACI4E0_04580 [Blautia sp.]
MKNTGYILAGAGLIGTMVGASALDGPDMAAGIAIMAAGLAALGTGDLLIKIQRKEVMQHEIAEKVSTQRKESTFRNWIESGKLVGVQGRQ